ncbi:hypothetical protein TNCV_4380021 [Trichonephila clavipes]|nr:hypothetical protein TNCV_4380021 [Trichonephila clavipes]
MPRKRKSNLSQRSNSARAMKVARFNETFPQAELRRLEQAERDAAHRAAKTPEQFPSSASSACNLHGISERYALQ